MSKASLFILAFYSFTLRQRHTQNWVHCQTTFPTRQSELCCPPASGAGLGRKGGRRPAPRCLCLGVGVGYYCHSYPKEGKGTAREEGLDTEGEIRHGFPIGLGTLFSLEDFG